MSTQGHNHEHKENSTLHKIEHAAHAMLDNLTEGGARTASGFAPVADQTAHEPAGGAHTRQGEIGDSIKSVTAEAPREEPATATGAVNTK